MDIVGTVMDKLQKQQDAVGNHWKEVTEVAQAAANIQTRLHDGGRANRLALGPMKESMVDKTKMAGAG